MEITGSVRRTAAFSRIAFLALLFVTMAVTLHVGAFKAEAAQASLSWSAPTKYTDGTAITSLGGYNVYVGSASRSYQQKINVGNSTSYQLSNLTDGSTYYFAVTAYDGTGSESGYSTEASKTFAALPVTHVITATSGAGGTTTALNNTKVNVATSGSSTITSVTVTDGATQAFTVAPASGYTLSDVKVDGASVGAVTSYSFTNVKADHTITATFAAAPVGYSISASTTTGGTISPAGTSTVSSGGSKTYTITPATGFGIAYVLADGVSVGAVSSYTFSNVQANHTIKAGFYAWAANTGGTQYVAKSGITYLADGRFSGGTAASQLTAVAGTVDPTLYQSWRYGSTFTYSVPVPNGNYDVTLKFCENKVTAAGQRMFDVAMQGTTVISSLDIYSRVGQNKAYDLTIPVSVTNGTLSIKFTRTASSANDAKVNGIFIAAK